MRKRIVGLTALLAIIVMASAGCVKVETSSAGPEQRTQSAENTAADLRSDWARRLDGATGPETAGMLGRQVDAITSRYVDYSRRVADEWRKGNDGRGQPIPDTEMREFVQGWVSTEQPILTAHDDMVEYAYAQLREGREVDESTIEVTRRLIESYYELYTAVFFPTGTVVDYEYTVGEARSDIEEILTELELDLNRYF
ncbi:hypothetical protein GF420_16265 [candidate division GN15 bacterium]|nr:hypothetical protein [candidate division GN15 bacterium]